MHIMNGVSWCECDCHKDGEDTLHFMECCDVCYKKYINVDGTVDMARLRKAVDEHIKRRNQIREEKGS